MQYEAEVAADNLEEVFWEIFESGRAALVAAEVSKVELDTDREAKLVGEQTVTESHESHRPSLCHLI